jgi:hypothetical protein
MIPDQPDGQGDGQGSGGTSDNAPPPPPPPPPAETDMVLVTKSDERLVPLMAIIATFLVVAYLLYHVYQALFVDAANAFLP